MSHLGQSVCVFVYYITVVPALGDPRRERPPAVYGHFVNVPTHFNVKLPLISGHLSKADSNFLLSAPGITDSVNKCRDFRGHCRPKSLARTQTRGRQFAQISVMSSGDQRVTSSRLINHVIAANQPIHWLRLFHGINGKVTYYVCSTGDVEEQNDS